MKKLLEQNRLSWNANSKFYYGTTALPQYGCNLKNENQLNLFEDIKGKKILEIGYGSGHSMKYLANKGVAELWGIDISERQKETAAEVLSNLDTPVTLMISPMEENPGIPEAYFDIAFSIYALGWTLDLEKTLHNISRYLKKDGIFIFSWDHPFMHCVDEVDEELHFTGLYHDEDLFSWEKNSNKLSIINRKFSTYINSLYKAGFVVENLIEDTNDEVKETEFASAYYSEKKLNHFPLSFIIKARKVR